jgi:hypothetical protein
VRRRAPGPKRCTASRGCRRSPPPAATRREHLATNLITQWVKRNARYSEPAWLPQVIAERLVHLFADGRFVLANSDVLWRSKLFVSMREQSRLLARTRQAAPDGLPRFEAAAAHVLSGACLDDSAKRLQSGLNRLAPRSAPDSARWRPCQPFAGSAAACLSPCRDGDGCADGHRPSGSALRSAARMTAWRRCCVSSAWATARWRCSTAGANATPK